MSSKRSLMMLAAFAMAAASQNEDLFDMGSHRAKYQPQPQTRKNLPRFKVGDHIIYARNEKEALKYAKKRGLYKPGLEAIKIDPI